MLVPITRGYLIKENRKVTIDFIFSSSKEADEFEADWNRALEESSCPSCRILWEQTSPDKKRHCDECKWPEILMERNRKKIQELEAKNAELANAYPPRR